MALQPRGLPTTVNRLKETPIELKYAPRDAHMLDGSILQATSCGASGTSGTSGRIELGDFSGVNCVNLGNFLMQQESDYPDMS